MIKFHDYSKEYENLPAEICIFFSEPETKDDKLAFRKTHSFCNYYHKKYSAKEWPQPREISKICDILCENHLLSSIERSGPDGINNSYYCRVKEEIKTDEHLRFYYNKKLWYIIYGFKYIYEDYKKYVLPIEFTDNEGNILLGTCFLYNEGIVTAKHCIEGAIKISIKGISKTALEKAKFEICKNELMDLLFVRFETPVPDTILFSQNAEILDEVMTLGYPKIAGYHNFLTAENASVSARFTTSVGQIASNAEDIWMKEKLFLITAKIKGGNSGGPIISSDGSILGVAVNQTKGDGDYDDLGYGTVIPVSFLNDLINSEEKTYLDTSKIEFKDFN